MVSFSASHRDAAVFCRSTHDARCGELLWRYGNDALGVYRQLGEDVRHLRLVCFSGYSLAWCAVTFLCLVLGFSLAWLFVRMPAKLQPLVIFIIMLPLLTSVVVRTFAWIVILGKQGIVNNWLIEVGWISEPTKLLYTRSGLVVALANVQLPLMVLPLITALQRIESSLSDASASLGASEWYTFKKIIMPLALPGVIAGCLLTFSAAITAFISQSLIGGGQMLFMPMYLYQQVSALSNFPFAAVISITFLVTVVLCVTAFNTLGRLSRGYAAG